MKMKEEESNSNPLKDKKVTKFKISREGGWPPKGKAGADGLYPGAGHFFSGALYDINKRKYVDPLTEDEKDFFSSEYSTLRIDRKRFNLLEQKNFWSEETRIKLTEDPLTLDLSDEMDYLRWKYLLSQKESIAPSWEDRKAKASYKFAIRDFGEEDERTVEKIQKEKLVNRHFYKIENNPTQLAALLKMYYYQTNSTKKVSSKAGVSTLSAELYNVIERDLDKVYDILQDKNLETKLTIYEAVDAGVIEKPTRYEYQVVGREETMNMTDMIKFLSAAKNSDILIELRAKIDSV